MKKVFALGCLLALASLIPFNTAAVESDDAVLKSLLDFRELRTVKVSQEEKDAAEYFRSMAHSIGLQAGSFYASNSIRSRLEADASLLDRLYDFNRLGMVKFHKGVYIVNPVLLEIKKSYAVSPDARSFTVIDQRFIIEKEPYLTLTIPSWRDYLIIDAEPVQVPEGIMLPKTPSEVAIWQKSMLEGYELGVKQVQQLTTDRLMLLTRDLLGMERYKQARQRNLISEVKLAEAYYPVSGGGNKLNIAQTRVSIDINPALNSNRWDWKPLPQLADLSEIFPNADEVRQWPKSYAK